MIMTKFKSVLMTAAISLCCIPMNSAAADLSPNKEISAFSANKQAGYNPCNKQDNKEVPYDGSKWLQPIKWGSTKINPKNYTGKAKLWFDKISIPVDEAKEMAKNGKAKRICFNADGIQDKVASMRFHIYYDTRLTAKKIGRNYILSGEAVLPYFYPIETFIENGAIKWETDAGVEVSNDGDVFYMDLILPKNVKVGDIYPIGIEYTNDGTTNDLFINERQNDEGKLLMSYVFTQGIQNGYIKIEKHQSLGDPNGDGDINAVDASDILTLYTKTSTQKTTLTAAQKSYYDVNKDGRADAVDASYVLSYYTFTQTGGTDSFADYMKNH